MRLYRGYSCHPFETLETKTERQVVFTDLQNRGHWGNWPVALVGNNFKRGKGNWSENKERTRYQRLTCPEQQRRGREIPQEQPVMSPEGRRLKHIGQRRCGPWASCHRPRGQHFWLHQNRTEPVRDITIGSPQLTMAQLQSFWLYDGAKVIPRQ